MGRTPLGINDHGLAHEDARKPRNCSPISLPELRRRSCSLGKRETNSGTLWRDVHCKEWREQAPT